MRVTDAELNALAIYAENPPTIEPEPTEENHDAKPITYRPTWKLIAALVGDARDARHKAELRLREKRNILELAEKERVLLTEALQTAERQRDDLVNDLEEAREHRRILRECLLRTQWIYTSYQSVPTGSICPVCSESRITGHTTTCPIRNALAATEEKTDG